MQTINSEKDSLDTALKVAPTAIGNLSLAYNSQTGTIGSRIGVSGNLWDADGFLCSVVQQASLPGKTADLACAPLQAAARAGRGPAAHDPAAPRPQGAAANRVAPGDLARA